MPTSTVEDYLKCVYLGQERSRGALVSPGQIAASLGVAPGTVTAMMKTLTESGLASYEPYAGVRLTRHGEKLARHVLRRHRLVELFLVRVMGMDWSTVHKEAEVLEHTISDRLLERMDEMLGHPEVDPHGDPIPTAAGQMVQVEHQSLLSCPLDRTLAVARVTDQREDFLKLLDKHRITPGDQLSVLSRDELAETVTIQPEKAPSLQLGYRAADRVLVIPA